MIAFTNALRRAYVPLEALPNELLAQASFRNPSESGSSQPCEIARRLSTLESTWREWSAPSPDGEHADPEKERGACGLPCGNERVRSVRVPVEVDRDEARVRAICLVVRRAWRAARGKGRLDVAHAAEDEGPRDGQHQEKAAQPKRPTHGQILCDPRLYACRLQGLPAAPSGSVTFPRARPVGSLVDGDSIQGWIPPITVSIRQTRLSALF